MFNYRDLTVSPSQMRRESFVCTSKIMASFNQWSVILILCLQFQRLVCTLSFRSLKNTVALANVKCHTLRPDKLRPKCFKTSKVIIAKCLISKQTALTCFHGRKCPSQSHTVGARPDFPSGAFRTLRLLRQRVTSLGLPVSAFRGCRGPSCVWTGQREPFSSCMEIQSCLNEHTPRSPPVQSKLCEELLVPGPFLQPLLEMLPGGPGGFLATGPDSTVCVLTPRLAALQEVPKLAPVLGGTDLIYIKKRGWEKGSLSHNPK